MIKLALFAAALALAFGVAAVAGAALDPDPGSEPERHADAGERKHGGGGHQTASAPTGLALAQAGMRLDLDHTRIAPGSRERLAFRIVDEDGRAVTDFDVEHDRRMHLIVVRRDLTGFQHLHPEMAPDGTWSTDVVLGEPGSYRAFADFSSGGESRTLGGDLQVAGAFEPRELPHPAVRAVTDDGEYEVRLANDEDELRFTVHAGGRRVEDVEPYLGARGHLVALREGDLAFLHVHPESEATEGGDIRFRVEYPSEGRYRLFLQFKHDGRVHTAAFTQEIGLAHGH